MLPRVKRKQDLNKAARSLIASSRCSRLWRQPDFMYWTRCIHRVVSFRAHGFIRRVLHPTGARWLPAHSSPQLRGVQVPVLATFGHLLRLVEPMGLEWIGFLPATGLEPSTKGGFKSQTNPWSHSLNKSPWFPRRQGHPSSSKSLQLASNWWFGGGKPRYPLQKPGGQIPNHKSQHQLRVS